MGKHENSLIVIFDEDKVQILRQWKLKLLGLKGKGAIKARTQELVEEDLNNLNNNFINDE